MSAISLFQCCEKNCNIPPHIHAPHQAIYKASSIFSITTNKPRISILTMRVYIPSLASILTLSVNFSVILCVGKRGRNITHEQGVLDPSPTKQNNPKSTIIYLSDEFWGTHQATDAESEKAHRAEQDLENWFLRIKTFISNEAFNVAGFSIRARDFENELAAIQGSVSDMEESPSLTQRLFFANCVSYIMTKATRLLLHYSGLGIPGARLLYKIAELSVRVLALYNGEGMLDQNQAGYAAHLTTLINNLAMWSARFEELPGVSHEFFSAFRTEYNQAEKLLKMLQNQVPAHEEFFVNHPDLFSLGRHL
ncbi:hypothetical protein JCM33374_g1676 [Metschnikowia sp. JCM 33374]|nr:hypothetical protein JCM33374_g1676 [Metschnikowia sp. JCM 33374]